jgi:glycosyltransferase involved in cell wall biosynthesis
MKVAINAMSASIGSGPGFYSRVMPALAALNDGNEYVALFRDDQQDLIAQVPQSFQTLVFKGLSNSFLVRTFWEQFVLPFVLNKHKFDVLLSDGNTTSLMAPCKNVMVVTNATPYSRIGLRYPLGFSIKMRLIRWASILSARVCDAVVFISNDSRERIAPILGIPFEHTEVVYYGFVPEPVQPGPVPAGKYILTVSLLREHKNLERLMLAFAQLVERGDYDGKLVIAGAEADPVYTANLHALRDRLAIRDHIEFTGRVTNEQLGALYRGAQLFVFPSLEETLGMPLLEAMGYGLPIAASAGDLSPQAQQCFLPFRELAGDAAVYFDPYDPQAMADAMAALLKDPDRAADLGRRGAVRVREYSWTRTATELSSVFNRVAQPVPMLTPK